MNDLLPDVMARKARMLALSLRCYEPPRMLSREIRLTVGGVTKTVGQWAKANGVRQNTIHQRLYRGWKPERAVRK